MAVLTAAVLVLAAIVMVNLAVTVALIKRLRTGAVTAPDARRRPDGPGGLRIGSPAPEFSAETVDGTVAGPETRAGRRALISFFATDCPGCSRTAPSYSAEAATLAQDGILVLTVLETTAGTDAAPLTAQLSLAGTMVVEERSGPIMNAFGAIVTPSFFLVGADGRIEGKGLTLEEALPAVAAARG